MGYRANRQAFRAFRHLPAYALVIALALGATGASAATDAQAPKKGCGASANEVRLELTIEDVRSDRGTISVAVYGDRPEDFLAKGKKVAKLRLPAEKGVVAGCLVLPKLGTYAVAAYHDEDGDRKLTRNFIGLPEEGVAISNDPEMVLGIPSHQQAAFAVDRSPLRLQLKMHYR